MSWHRWPEAIVVAVAAVLLAALPPVLVPGPQWLQYALAGSELVLGVLLVADDRRRSSLLVLGLAGLANGATLGYLIHQLLYSGGLHGRTLLFAAFDIWVTNVIVFGLVYWELDGASAEPTDLAFVQMTDPELAPKGWHPRFVDYLYVAFTNASAFSPTDTLPLTRRAKMLMLLQSTVSLVTLLLVAARAVNILR